MFLAAVVFVVSVGAAHAGTPDNAMYDVAEVWNQEVVSIPSTTCPSEGIEPCWIEFELSEGAKIVCQYPWYDFNLCEDIQQGDCLTAEGFTDYHLGEVVIFATGVTLNKCEENEGSAGTLKAPKN